MRHRHACHTIDAPRHLVAILRNILATTWYMIDGATQPTAYHMGTRQGDPLGDLLYGLVANVALRRIKASLAEQ
eukprot:276104-Alexandrium_andersonii.AAC.1